MSLFSRLESAAPAKVNSARRRFLAGTGLAGAAALGSGLIGGTQRADAAQSTSFGPKGHRKHVSDTDILNFALNLEYLEAEFYLRAVNGTGLADSEITGIGGPGSDKTSKTPTTPGAVTGGTKVNFTVPLIQQYATEIAADEHAHVLLLRSVLGKKAVARPAIDFTNAFTAAAIAAGVIPAGQTFDPFSSDDNFLLGAFIFEDVGVTAYHGAAPFIQKSAILSAAAGLLGTEAYHAGLIRTVLIARGQTNASLISIANQISGLRATADKAAGGTGNDQGITNTDGTANIVPTDDNGLVFSRTFDEVLEIVYLANPAGTGGGFFPSRTNGLIS